MPAPFKTAVYDQIARIGKATASAPRLEILDLLGQGPRTVESIAGQIGQTLANTSHHLQVLRSVRLVDTEKAGTYVTYRLADPQVGAFVLHLRGLAAGATRRARARNPRLHGATRRHGGRQR